MTKDKEIQMREVVDFCHTYNMIGYGEAEIVELDGQIIVKLYNAGFSDNEERDSVFREKYSRNIIFDRHPIIIAEFSKLDLRYNYHVVGFENLKDWCDCYKREKTFKYKVEIN